MPAVSVRFFYDRRFGCKAIFQLSAVHPVPSKQSLLKFRSIANLA